MIDDPRFYLAAAGAVLITGISKSGFGGGLGALGVPLMALVISPLQAAAILLPLLCIMDLINLWIYRHHWDATNLKILIPAGLIGVVLGTFTFRYLSDAHIRIIIGAIAVTFALNFFRGQTFQAPRPASVPLGTLWGVISGFVSFGVHAGAPPVNVYLLPQRLDKTTFVGTLVVMFAVLNYIKLIPYTLLGQFQGGNLLTGLMLLPLIPVGIWIGLKLHRIVSEKTFYRFCYVFLMLMGLRLLFDGYHGL